MSHCHLAPPQSILFTTELTRNAFSGTYVHTGTSDVTGFRYKWGSHNSNVMTPRPAPQQEAEESLANGGGDKMQTFGMTTTAVSTNADRREEYLREQLDHLHRCVATQAVHVTLFVHCACTV